ncbi:glycosyltransferase [Hymenobacter rubidus]|uniref:glycosyltransferase n=1 Tax=Hymenobacter rubidus TaxID=1441626 RepID=UPI003742B9B0
MRGKFAETLLERPHTQVHIAGRAPAVPDSGQGSSAKLRVAQHSIFQGSRLSLARLTAQWRYWQLLRRLRPALVIVHAPELLPLTLMWQRLAAGRHFLYDIRENYALNVSTQGVYTGLLRRGLAAGLRWVEAQAARRAAGIILAEESYAAELPFLSDLPAGRVVVLENKYQPTSAEILPREPHTLPSPHEPLRLLFSGTISKLNGLWEAVEVAEALHHGCGWPGGVVLTIVGFCQQPELLRELQERISELGFIRLIGGAALVPHTEIVAEIGRSHLGLALYRPHPSTERCRPTKLFEYLAHGLPVLVPANPLWQTLIQQHDAGLTFDLNAPSPSNAVAALLKELMARTKLAGRHFYRNGVPASVLWAEEGKKLWHLLDTVV